MCEVCVAENAIRTTSCGNETCPSYLDGYRCDWDDAPKPPAPKPGKRKLGKLHGHHQRRRFRALRVGLHLVVESTVDPVVFVRATGKAEGPGRYQIRRVGEPWPKAWTKTSDVAGSMAAWGLGMKWHVVAKCYSDVARWIQRRGPKPAVERGPVLRRKAGQAHLLEDEG